MKGGGERGFRPSQGKFGTRSVQESSLIDFKDVVMCIRRNIQQYDQLSLRKETPRSDTGGGDVDTQHDTTGSVIRSADTVSRRPSTA